MNIPTIKTLSNLSLAHFIPPDDESLRKKLFTQVVKLVGIEITSYCNRRCAHCPNFFLDRNSFQEILAEELFIGILAELKSMNYKNRIAFQQYNEPTANKDLFIERIKQARRLLPESELICNSNGDYLDLDFCYQIASAGLNSLLITAYMPPGTGNAPEIITDYIKRRIELTGLARFFFMDEERMRSCANINGLEIIIRAKDYSCDEASWNRGGLLKSIKPARRASPCMRPFSTMSIEYNGNVMLCCNTRSDAHQHQDFIIGNIGEDSLLNIYFSEKVNYFRRQLLNFSNNLMTPCNTCNLDIMEDNYKNRANVSRILTSTYHSQQTSNRKRDRVIDELKSAQSELNQLSQSKWVKFGKFLKVIP